MKDFFSRLTRRLTNLRTGWDYLWAGIIVLNLYGVLNGLATGNIPGAVLSGVFLALCLYSV